MRTGTPSSLALRDAHRERSAREAHDPHRHAGIARRRCAAVHRDPDFKRQLRCEFVESQRAQQTDNALRYSLGRQHKIMVFGDLGVGCAIEIATHPLDFATAHEAIDNLRVNALIPDVAQAKCTVFAAETAKFLGFCRLSFHVYKYRHLHLCVNTCTQ